MDIVTKNKEQKRKW